MIERKKFEVRIARKEEYLDVEVTYESKCTEQDKKILEILYKLNGKQNNPADTILVTTGFRVTLGKKLYLGLERVNEQALYVLPKLVDELKKYNAKDSNETALVNHAISELEKIIKKNT